VIGQCSIFLFILACSLQAYAQGDVGHKYVNSEISARSDVNQAWMCGEGWCPATSGHSITGARIFNGMGGIRLFSDVDPGQLYSVMTEACAYYAEAHSNGSYFRSFEVCNPHLDALKGVVGGQYVEIPISGTIVVRNAASGQIVDSSSGTWGIGDAYCSEASGYVGNVAFGSDGRCYCRPATLPYWDAARGYCSPEPIEPPKIALSGDTVTHALIAGPALPELATVTKNGAPVAGANVSISIDGGGNITGVTDGNGQFAFTYVPPYVATTANLTGTCTTCSNTATLSI